MKKTIFICFVLVGLFALVLPKNLTIAAETPPSAADNCKVEVIDCPSWGTGDRQVCHVNGGGVACTCGDSTKCK